VLEAISGKPLSPAQSRSTMDRLGTEATMALLRKLAELPLSKEEAEIVAIVEKSKGRKLTQQEINLSLRQARDLGVI